MLKPTRIFSVLGGVALIATLLTVSCSTWLRPQQQSLPDRMLRHDGFSWRTHETAEFWIHCEADSYAEREIVLLTKVHAMAMPGILELIGEPVYSEKIHIFAVENRARMKTLIGRATNGKSFPVYNTTLCVFSEQTKAGGAHELMHVISNNCWGKVPFQDRIWLNEGLACYADDKCDPRQKPWKTDMHTMAKRLRNTGRLVPLKQLTAGYTNWAALPSAISYPEAGSFIRFLYERHGRDKLKTLWQATSPEFEAIYGKSLAELEVEWLGILENTEASEIAPSLRY